MAEFDDCCKFGFKWDGKPIGTEGKLANNVAYITGTNKDAAVLFIHDIFGWTLPNARLLADHFAKEANVTCYLPDFFDGEVLPEKKVEEAFTDPAGPTGEKMRLLDLPAFIGRNTKQIRGPEMLTCAKALKASYKKVGAVGYCYGGWACLQLGAKGIDVLDCLTIAHPSMVEKSEVDTLGVPTQIIAPEQDLQLTPELKEYCNKVIPRLGLAYRYDYYPGLAHGFATKGDPNNPIERGGLERAKRAAVNWFNEYLH